MQDRIISFLKLKQLTAAQFAKSIGIQRSRLSHILSGRNKPNLDFVQKMLTTYKDLNPEWLLFGKGEIYLDRLIESKTTKNYDLFSSPPTSHQKDKIKLVEINKEQMAHPQKKVKKIIIFYSDKSFEDYYPGNS